MEGSDKDLRVLMNSSRSAHPSLDAEKLFKAGRKCVDLGNLMFALANDTRAAVYAVRSEIESG